MRERGQISRLKQAQKDKKQDIHRTLNSLMVFCILVCAVISSYAIRDKFGVVEEENLVVKTQIATVSTKVDNRFNELSATQHRTSEISQLMMDEGFRKCVYADSRGLATIGFGHLMLPTDSYTCITYRQAVELLREDYDYAAKSVDNRYPWAYGEVRLVLINMTYQMGQSGVSKFKKSLNHMREENYDETAIELLESNWARQTPQRALRLAGRIMSISVQEEVKQ